MQWMATRLQQGDKNFEIIVEEAERQLTLKGWRPDGIAICDAQTLKPITDSSEHAVILMAAWLGKARLIDNHQVSLPIR